MMIRKNCVLLLLGGLSTSFVLNAEEKTLDIELTGEKVNTPDFVELPERVQEVEEKKTGFEFLSALLEHPEVSRAELDVERWKREKKIALAPWLPNLSASFQWEDATKYNHPTLGDQDQSRSVTRASVDQLLFDFGEGYFQYQVAAEEWKGKKAELFATRDRVIFEGVGSVLQALLQEKLLDQAIASEENFLKQKELEEQKVKGGQGFSTDVLQVEVQHLGAVAKVHQTRLDLNSAREKVSRWWGESAVLAETKLLEKLEELMSKTSVPSREGMADWIGGAPAILENRHAQQAMQSRKKAMMGGRWGPKVSLRFLTQRGEELGGVGSYDREERVSVQAELPLNLGGTSIDEVASLGVQLEALAEQGRVLEREIREGLQVALLTFRAKEELVSTRRDQMDVAQRYLEGAEKERLMGRRSLIDVLNGELLRLQAESEMERARIDRVLAWSRLFQLGGRLGQILSLK